MYIVWLQFFSNFLLKLSQIFFSFMSLKCFFFERTQVSQIIYNICYHLHLPYRYVCMYIYIYFQSSTMKFIICTYYPLSKKNRSQRFRPYNVYIHIFLNRITGRVDLAMSICPYRRTRPYSRLITSKKLILRHAVQSFVSSCLLFGTFFLLIFLVTSIGIPNIFLSHPYCNSQFLSIKIKINLIN